MPSIDLSFASKFPVHSVLGDVAHGLKMYGRCVLSAPPGAGKTTIVPLDLLSRMKSDHGTIILLEPRRLAARAAAMRMADLLGEPVGKTIGYRMRLDSRTSEATRIIVVTEGVFARMLLDDPELAGVHTVIFDEFHERSLDGDFGLALALDVQQALRDDLRILVMSATLDVERIGALLGDAPVVKSEGRSFPIEIRYDERSGTERIEDKMARTILDSLHREAGSILSFLPGQAEISRTAERLADKLPSDVDLHCLFGTLTLAEQSRAIQPAGTGRRKVVLATSIAETSITIDGVRVVIDSGLQRLPVYEASTGITRLETTRVSQASATQRAGRAGRTQEGVAIRLWHKGQTAALPEFTPAQILSSDLTQFVLDLASWGVSDTSSLSLLDHPPMAALTEAKHLLQQLDALGQDFQITAKGKKLRQMALPPRLAAMVLECAEHGHAKEAAQLAVLLTEQGLGGSDTDLELRLRYFLNDRSERAKAAKGLAQSISKNAGATFSNSQSSTAPSAGQMLLHAFPDRVAFQRGKRGRYIMANGRGAEIDEFNSLANHEILVIADLSGKAANARILAAAAISRGEIEDAQAHLITSDDIVTFDAESGNLRARRIKRLGAITLEESNLPRPTGEAAIHALAKAIEIHGVSIIPFPKEALALRNKLDFLHRTMGAPWPDVSDRALQSTTADWFIPFHAQINRLQDLKSSNLIDGLMSLVPFDMQREIARLLPSHFDAPTGQRHPITYEGDEPVLTIRVQELFGLKMHPSIANGRLPLVLKLTSPAHRPIQTTRDLPGFWSGSWKDVRADMRGRYPKHPWPEDPANALPTHRAKPRGT